VDSLNFSLASFAVSAEFQAHSDESMSGE